MIYGSLPSPKIRCGFLAATSRIVWAKTLFAHANQLPAVLSVPVTTSYGREILTGVFCDAIHIDTLMNETKTTSPENNVQGLLDLGIVIRSHCLKQQTHWPGIFKADVRSCEESVTSKQILLEGFISYLQFH